MGRVCAVSQAPSSDWLARFHAGDRETLAECYRKHYHVAATAVGQLLAGADKETVVHEVFYRLVADESQRRKFTGQSFAAWLRTVAKNQAIDYRRRRERRSTVPPESLAHIADQAPAFTEQVHARLLLQRFQDSVLPQRYRGVFVERFVHQKSQREAASSLQMRRTTLAYQELRIRGLLRRFVFREEDVS